jgi:hypothetical protein
MIRTDRQYAGSSGSKDADEVTVRMGTDEDDPDDSDNDSDYYKSIDAERDAQ